MKATDIQIGGDHYKKMVIQPIEFITACRLSFIQGCVVKYICRYESKNGIQDVTKCQHYAFLAMQLEHKKGFHKQSTITINEFCTKNNLSLIQRKIITAALYCTWPDVVKYTDEIIKQVNKV